MGDLSPSPHSPRLYATDGTKSTMLTKLLELREQNTKKKKKNFVRFVYTFVQCVTRVREFKRVMNTRKNTGYRITRPLLIDQWRRRLIYIVSRAYARQG